MGEPYLPTYNMGQLPYPDIQEYLRHKDIIMVPLASLEQHSYHMPLLTDNLEGLETVWRVSEEARVLSGVLPQKRRGARC